MQDGHMDASAGKGTHLVLDLAGNVPEAGVLGRLPARALDCGRERLFRRLCLAPQSAHLLSGRKILDI